MKSKFLTILLTAMILPVIPGMSGGSAFAKTAPMGGIKPMDKDLVKSQTEFAFDFFKEVVKDDYGHNVFVSPLSASLALAMTYNGAEKDTRSAMADALRLKGYETDRINDFYNELVKSLLSIDPMIEMNIANSIWYRKDFSFKDSFFKEVTENYKAELEPLTDAVTINKWVDKQTRGKIKNIIDNVAPLDLMILINAIYFKGMWTSKFKEDNTHDQDFELADGTKIQQPLMAQNGKFDYTENDLFQAINLPYGNRDVSMYVFLPNKDLGLKGFLDSLNSEKWSEWWYDFNEREGEIRLPRFKIEYDKTLNNTLVDMGMGVAFNPNKADFSGLFDSPPGRNLFISEVRQKTYVEVNEEGTEAAAVTSVTLRLTSAMPDQTEKFSMIVDRPFFLTIVDNRTRTILFMGAIIDPRG